MKPKPSNKGKSGVRRMRGFDVKIFFKKDSPFGEVEEIRHNVTEIHYLYHSLTGERDSVAFESDTHSTGGTIKVAYIKEFEAKLATKITYKLPITKKVNKKK